MENSWKIGIEKRGHPSVQLLHSFFSVMSQSVVVCGHSCLLKNIDSCWHDKLYFLCSFSLCWM